MAVEGMIVPVFLLGSVVAAALLLWGLLPPSAHGVMKQEERTRRDEERRQHDEHEFAQVMPRVVEAGHLEAREIAEIMPLVERLDAIARLQLEFAPRIKHEIERELREGLKKTHQAGLPEAYEMKKLCIQQNDILKRIREKLMHPEKIIARIMHFVEKEAHKIRSDTHHVDEDERQLEAMHGESRAERRAIHTRDHLEKDQVGALDSVYDDEKKVEDLIRSTRRKCRGIWHINQDIIEFSEKRSIREALGEKIAKGLIRKLEQRENLIKDLIVSLKTIAVYEKDLEQSSVRAFHDAQKMVA